MTKFATISLTFILYTQLLALNMCAAAECGPLSQYCQKIKPQFIAVSKSIPELKDIVTIDFRINGQGEIEQAAVSKDSEGSYAEKEIALKKIRNLRRVAAIPATTQFPVWLTTDLCNHLENVSVGFRDIGWGSYVGEIEHKIENHWFPPKSSESKSTTLTFKILPDGNISDLKVYKGSGLGTMDLAGLEAVKISAPFSPPLDGTSDPIRIQFTLDYRVHPYNDSRTR